MGQELKEKNDKSKVTKNHIISKMPGIQQGKQMDTYEILWWNFGKNILMSPVLSNLEPTLVFHGVQEKETDYTAIYLSVGEVSAIHF